MPVRSKMRRASNTGITQPQRLKGDNGGSWNNTERHTFGSYFKAERVRRGYSRHALASTTGIQEKRLAEIESGSAMPSIPDLRAISSVLEVSETDLLSIAGYIKRE